MRKIKEVLYYGIIMYCITYCSGGSINYIRRTDIRRDSIQLIHINVRRCSGIWCNYLPDLQKPQKEKEQKIGYGPKGLFPFRDINASLYEKEV